MTIFKKSFFLIALNLAFGFLNAQEPLKVLFIGNSYTEFWDTPNMFRELSIAAGKEVFVDDRAVSGTSLGEHSLNQATIDKIYEQKWDYVILQGGSLSIAFPRSHVSISGPITTLRRFIRENHSQTKVFYLLAWAPKDGLTINGIDYTYDAFQDLIITGTKIFADKMSLLISPVGSAWKHVIDDKPEIELFAPDKGHPSLRGAYLQSCVYYAAIFGESVLNNSFTSTLSGDEALYFQEVASNTVLDNLEQWNLPTKTSIDEYIQVGEIALLYPNPVISALNVKFKIPVSKVVATLFIEIRQCHCSPWSVC